MEIKYKQKDFFSLQLELLRMFPDWAQLPVSYDEEV